MTKQEISEIYLRYSLFGHVGSKWATNDNLVVHFLSFKVLLATLFNNLYMWGSLANNSLIYLREKGRFQRLYINIANNPRAECSWQRNNLNEIQTSYNKIFLSFDNRYIAPCTLEGIIKLGSTSQDQMVGWFICSSALRKILGIESISL